MAAVKKFSNISSNVNNGKETLNHWVKEMLLRIVFRSI